MISPKEFYEILIKNGVDFFAGVPDSLLKSLCAYVSDNTPSEKNIITANEGGAVALAAGHYLATGRVGLVYMQNSGLGNAVNPLTSLADKNIYGIPMLLVIGWRGEPGVKDEPQHVKMGKITLKLLETMKIPYRILEDNFEIELKEAKEYMAKKSAPFALVVKKDTFESYKPKLKNDFEKELMSREEAVRTVLPLLEKNSIIVATTGMASRELFEIRETLKQGHEKDFLTVGSMGHASQIALGVAMEKPDRPVYCFDGDGSLIMHMGHLAVIGQKKPKNLRHIIFNNIAHDSVGGQPTAAASINIPVIAKANGYDAAFSAKTKKEIEKKIKTMRNSNGPSLLEIKVKKGARNDLGRPTSKPPENKKLFMDFLSNDSAEQLERILAEHGSKRIFLVTGKSSFISSGTADVFGETLAKYKTVHFYDFDVNPKLKDLKRGIRIFKNGKCDTVVAIGGGSVIDMAKLINTLSVQKGAPEDYIDKKKEIAQKGKILIAIPTTAGSGSEATHFAVIYMGSKKYSVAHKYLLPDGFILDSSFTMNLSPYLTASTGMDALCQAIESFWSLNATNESKKYSRKAIKLAVNNLKKAVKAPTPESRQAMMLASHLAGKAINISKTTAPHAISYTFTSRFGIPHGHAVGLTVGKVLEHNCKHNKGLKEIYHLLGVSNALSASKKLKGLMTSIGLETKLSRLGVKKKDLDLIVDNVNLERLKNNPAEITQKELKDILLSIL